MTEAKLMDVYTIIEKNGDKSFWVKLGACFTNRDGSFSVVLDALPTNGKLHIRSRQENRQIPGPTTKGTP